MRYYVGIVKNIITLRYEYIELSSFRTELALKVSSSEYIMNELWLPKER